MHELYKNTATGADRAPYVSFFFDVCIYNNTVRTLLWFTVVQLAACRRDDKCRVLEMDPWTGEIECFVLCSFLFGRRYRIEWIPVESGIHCIFILLRRTRKIQRIPDSTGIWPIAVDSSGTGLM
jgi:hypothetical protein